MRESFTHSSPMPPMIRVCTKRQDGARRPKTERAGARLAPSLAAWPTLPGSPVLSSPRALPHEASHAPLSLRRLLRREREDERRRMARDLHDELGQQLTVIQLALLPLLDGPDAGSARRMAVLVDEAFDSLRRLVRGWQPAALDGQGPTAALRALGRETSRRTGLHVRVRVSGTEAAVPHPVALALYRIAQESLTNAVRHACAGQVRILLHWQAQRVSLTIEDDGVGLPEGAPAGLDSLGLRGLKERVASLGGDIAFGTTRSGGTRIAARLPLSPAGPVGGDVPA